MICSSCGVDHSMSEKRANGEAPLLELDEWQRYVRCAYGNGPHCKTHDADCEMLPWPCGNRIYWSCARATVKASLNFTSNPPSAIVGYTQNLQTRKETA